MRLVISRLTFALGVFLLLGGWAGMRYADEQQQVESIGERRWRLWADGRAARDIEAKTTPGELVGQPGMVFRTPASHRDGAIASRDIMAVSGVALATGGLLVALSAPSVAVGVARSVKDRTSERPKGC